MSVKETNTFSAPTTKHGTSNVELNSFHIKQERLSIENKKGEKHSNMPHKLHRDCNWSEYFKFSLLHLVGASKPQTNIDDELYECIKVKDSDTNGFLNLSIQLTEAEMAETRMDTGPNTENAPNNVPAFLICNPVSIRPSQFPMNETNFNDTTAKDIGVEQAKDSLEVFQLDISKHSDKEVAKPEEASLIVVDDTGDLSSVCKSMSAVNRTRRETVHSPFKNRFATNPKLNETISAVKEIDPFDIHLQNALLDDIDFIEYIKSLEYVNIMTRVRAIELATDLEIGDETFTMIELIGKGSFGFVYRWERQYKQF